MKRRRFCVSLLSLLLACVMVLSFPVESKAASRNAAYCKVLKSLEKKYGKLKMRKAKGYPYSGGYYATGVCYAGLVDLNNDGNEELVVVYCKKNCFNSWNGGYSHSYYRVRVYTYSNGKASFAGEVPVSYGQNAQAYLNIVNLNGKKLIESNTETSAYIYIYYELKPNGKLKQKFKEHIKSIGPDVVDYYVGNKRVSAKTYAKKIKGLDEGYLIVHLSWLSNTKKKELSSMMKKIKKEIGY